MKIALVGCPSLISWSPSLALASLQATLKSAGHEVEVFDFALELSSFHPKRDRWINRVNYLHHIFRLRSRLIRVLSRGDDHILEGYAERVLSSEPDAICFTTQRSNLIQSAKLSKILKRKRPRVKTLFGGPPCHFSFTRNFLRKEGLADHVVETEGDLVILEILQNLGKDSRGIPRKILANLDNEPLPDFTGLEPEKYLFKELPYATTRGCYRKCDFCMDTHFSPAYRIKSPDKILNDIKTLQKKYDVHHFNFSDSTTLGTAKHIERFCEVAIRSGMSFTWGGFMRAEGLTPEIIKKMRKAGCSWILVGVESGSQRIVDRMGKHYDLGKIETSLRCLRKEGIKAVVTIIVGHPWEGFTDFLKTARFVSRNRRNAQIMHYNALALFEGTPLYDNAQSYGIRNRDSFFWSSRGNSFMIRMMKLSLIRVVDRLSLWL